MRKTWLAGFLFLFCFFIRAQSAGNLSISLNPCLSIPLVPGSGNYADNTIYTIGGGAGLDFMYVLPFAPFFHLGGSLAYTLHPTSAGAALSIITLSAGGGLLFTAGPIAMNINLEAGGYFGFYKDATGGNPFAKTGLGITWNIIPALGISTGASYKYLFTADLLDPLYQGVDIYLKASYNLGSGGAARFNIRIEQIELFPVFPVFYKYYDENPLGRLKIRNTEKGAIENVRISFFVQQYMAGSKECMLAEKMEKGAELNVPLYALFTDSILGITEATKVQAEITVQYTFSAAEHSTKKNETLRLYDRNAMTWDDDRKAAAFIAVKNPAVLKFAKNIAGIVREYGNTTINGNLRQTIGLFEALSLYGINYITDPKTPYSEMSQNKQVLDFLQFPIQTLEYKAGDCDDLSVLFCALLEAVGIETAFITVPGHIFMAFNLDMTKEEAGSTFLKPEDLIMRDGKCYVPVEITMIKQGFLKAWAAGAREWRENDAAGNANLYNIHEAWDLYEPVGMAGGENFDKFPDENKVKDAYARELKRFIDRELEPRISGFQEQIAGGNTKARMALGILYARYGLLDKAEEQFLLLVSAQNSPQAPYYLGNIYFLKEEYAKAVSFYTKALNWTPGNAFALLGLAKSFFELEQYRDTNKAFADLKKINSDLAGKYSYLESSAADTANRAADVDARQKVLWIDAE